MSSIVERRQTVSFDEAWHVVRWDEAPEFKGSMERAFAQLDHEPPRSVKAADGIAVRESRRNAPLLLVAELKDFDNPSVPAKHRARSAAQAKSDQLISDLTAKIIDTLCGATFATTAAGTRDVALEHWRRAVGHDAPTLMVLCCIEVPRTQLVLLTALVTKLKQRFRWLGLDARVVVTSSARPFDSPELGLSYRVG